MSEPVRARHTGSRSRKTKSVQAISAKCTNRELRNTRKLLMPQATLLIDETSYQTDAKILNEVTGKIK